MIIAVTALASFGLGGFLGYQIAMRRVIVALDEIRLRPTPIEPVEGE